MLDAPAVNTHSLTTLEKRVNRELKNLDPGLFLDKEFDRYRGYTFYCVRYDVGSGVKPMDVLAWRGVDGPWDLSVGIVDAVRRHEGDITEATRAAKLNNVLKKQKIKEQLMQDLEDYAKEHERSTGKLRRWFIPGTTPIPDRSISEHKRRGHI